MNIYFAAPLFTMAEREFNKRLATAIEEKVTEINIFLPQENSMFDEDGEFLSKETFKADLKAIDNCDLVLAILDGSDADSGTCYECGYAYNRKKILGIRTDFRSGEEDGLNVMLRHGVDDLLFYPCNDNPHLNPQNIYCLAWMIIVKIQELFGED
jgi:nucleoside 2-deoxyribosyltransferase